MPPSRRRLCCQPCNGVAPAARSCCWRHWLEQETGSESGVRELLLELCPQLRSSCELWQPQPGGAAAAWQGQHHSASGATSMTSRLFDPTRFDVLTRRWNSATARAVSRRPFASLMLCSSSKHQRKETPGRQRLQLISWHIHLHGRRSLKLAYSLTRPGLVKRRQCITRSWPEQGLALCR